MTTEEEWYKLLKESPLIKKDADDGLLRWLARRTAQRKKAIEELHALLAQLSSEERPVLDMIIIDELTKEC